MPDGVDAGDWIAAAGILVGSFVVATIVRRLTTRAVDEDVRTPPNAAARFVGRLVGLLVVAVGVVYALSVLGVRLGPVLGALGIGGIAIAFAAQSILENLIASLLLQSRRPFRLGDQIQTGEHEGTVEDINLRVVVLRSYDGERIFVPCASVLDGPIVNHTARGSRRTTLPVGVAYGTDLEQARKVLLDAVAGVDGVHARPEAEVWVEAFGESSIDFAVRFWHAPDIASLWRVRSAVAVAVKQALDAAGITIPFPQRTLWFPDRPE